MVAVALAISLDVIGHEIHCGQLFSVLCQMIGEAPDNTGQMSKNYVAFGLINRHNMTLASGKVAKHYDGKD